MAFTLEWVDPKIVGDFAELWLLREVESLQA